MEFLHYTSTEAAQSINAGRRLRPGSGGRIYLTPDAYDSGTDAVARLGLLGKPVEFCADLGDEKFVYDLSGAQSAETDGSTGRSIEEVVGDPEIVDPIFHPDSGVLERPGGGAEFVLPAGWVLVFSEDVSWRRLNLP